MAYGENIFTGMIDENGTIWDMATGRKRQAIGVDSQREQELLTQISEAQEKLSKYYTKLVELGAITVPKTPEEIAQETAEEQIRLAQEQAAKQAEINNSLLETNRVLLETMSKMNDKMGVLENGYARISAEYGSRPIKQDSKDIGPVAGAGKKRDEPSDKNATGNPK